MRKEYEENLLKNPETHLEQNERNNSKLQHYVTKFKMHYNSTMVSFTVQIKQKTWYILTCQDTSTLGCSIITST